MKEESLQISAEIRDRIMDRFEIIRERYKVVEDKIQNAAAKRSVPGTPRILLATKTVPPEEIRFAASLMSEPLIGENRVSELLSKYEEVKASADIHLIGSLQTNKVRKTVGKVSLIESVDSVRLASEINRISGEMGIVSDILAEINIGEEAAKGGLMPLDVEKFFEEIADFNNIRVKGIMTMAPKCEKKDDYRRYFNKTYHIFLDISEKYLYNIIEPVLSMGMSDSYEEAVLEGSGEVRVGSAVFGNRIYN